MPKLFVISLGGSLINPGRVDNGFLKNFRALILSQIKKGNRFILVTGGGKPARDYLEALKAVGNPTSDDLDWIGIFGTRFNAQLVRLMFGKLAHPIVIEDPNKKVKFKEKILVAGGWIPGRSSDYPAMALAKTYGAKTLINLSNIDYLYDKDPRKFKNAKKITGITWAGFRKIVGDKWSPGKNAPFDPTAAKFAQKNKFRVIIAAGKNLKDLENIFQGKKFQGTIIAS